MKKEGMSHFYNSRDGKVNTILLFSIFLVFILTVFYAEAISIVLVSPTNISINGTASRNINFTFNVTWSADSENMSNCTLWVNSTYLAWANVKNISVEKNGSASQPDDLLINSSLSGALSYTNYTFGRDGNYTWSIGCYRNNATQIVDFTDFTFGTGKSNSSFFIDTVAPTLTTQKPLGVLTLGQYANYTTFPIDIAVNVTDNTTLNVWYILNTAPGGLGTNETVAGVNFTTLMSRGDRIGNYTTYHANISMNNFTGGFRGPGPHSLYICANDSTNRQTCKGPLDWIPMGMNITVMENMMNDFGFTPPGSATPIVASLNITYGNGSEIPFGTFLNALSINMTMIFNTSADEFTHIVGMSIDEGKMGNVSNSNFSTTIGLGMRQAAGTGFSSKSMFAGIGRFIPDFASFTFGMIQLRGTGFGKMMYCNGTTSNPGCAPISRCNATVFSFLNITTINNVISSNEPRACSLDGADGTVNGNALSTGFTYIFVRKFSGGLGANDFSQGNVTWYEPAGNGTVINFSVPKTLVINFTLNDINSTGFNLTKNNTINLTVKLNDGTVLAYFNYTNLASITTLSCNTTDTLSFANTTIITCNASFGFNSNGTYNISIGAKDTSNNSNLVNASVSYLTVIIDQIPPRLDYFNITNSSSAYVLITLDEIKSYDNTPYGSVRQNFTIYLLANWTDNLTRPLRGDWQAQNQSAWVTVNESDILPNVSERTGWLNLSFTIPPGHNMFEGKNISFRVRANDTLGNLNISNRVLTIQINDTTKPELFVSIDDQGRPANFTNTTDSTPTIVWNVTENSRLIFIQIQVDTFTDPLCNTFRNFTTTVESNRNGTLTVLDTGGCSALTNGTHTINVTSQDTWGNVEHYIHQFTVQSVIPPTLNFISATLPNGKSLINRSGSNHTNMTPYTALNLTSTIAVSTQQIKNLSFTSSCNSTVHNYVNECPTCTSFNASVYPFNYTGCKNTEANQTVTVTVADFSGNSNSSVFGFLVDDVGPSIGVNFPTSGQLIINANTSINFSIKDNAQAVASYGYYLDGGVTINTLFSNTTGILGGAGTNGTYGHNVNITPVGTRSIKLTANDTLGNVGNSSVILFNVQGPIQSDQVNSSLTNYLINTTGYGANVSLRLKGAGNDYADIGSLNYSDSSGTFELFLALNITSALNNLNVTITEINGSGANWNKINFSVLINDTKIEAGLENNFTMSLFQFVWFNASIREFLPNENSYFGKVLLPYNLSGVTATAQQIWFFPNETNLSTRINVSQCTSDYSRARTDSCWNYTSGGKTLVFVPHFSGVGALNDTTAPTITINAPSTAAGNHTVSMFEFNITVSQDAASCSYSINATAGTANHTMTKSGTTCLGQTERFKTNNGIYNITFYATDTSNNIGSEVFHLNVSDTTAPNNGIITSSPSTTTATVAITGANESVNATVNYGTSNASLGSFAMETDFNVTQSVSLSGLSASTTYFFNVTVCDFNGNCKTNGSFSLTTSAAAAAAAAAAASSSGGGGGGAAVPTNVVASTSKKWDSLAAGASAVLNVNSADIAVTGVAVDVANTVANAEVKVASLNSNPLSAAAAAKVYQYLQLTKSNIADSDASKITINFKVPKSWLLSNNVAEGDVVLYRFSDSKWNALATTMTGSDANNVLYSAVTPGFSTFAIGNKEAAPPVTPEEKQAETPAPTTPPQPEAPKEAEKPTMPSEAKKGLSSTAMAWIAVAVIVIVAGIGYFMWQRKREE